MDLARNMFTEICMMMNYVGLETEDYNIDPTAYTMLPDYLPAAVPYKACPREYDYFWHCHGAQTMGWGAPFAASPESDSRTPYDDGTDKMLQTLVGLASAPPIKKKENDVVVDDVTVMNVMRLDVNNESGQPCQPQTPPPNHLLQEEVQAHSTTHKFPPPAPVERSTARVAVDELVGTKPADPLTQSPCQPKTSLENLLEKEVQEEEADTKMLGMKKVDDSTFTPSLPTQYSLVLLFQEAQKAADQLGGEYPGEVTRLIQDLTMDAFEINGPVNKATRLGVCTCCSTEEQIKQLRISLPIFFLRIMVATPFVRVFLLLPPELFHKFEWILAVYAAPLVTQSLIVVLHNFHENPEWCYAEGYNFICHWAWKYGANVVSPTDFPEQFLRLWGSDSSGSK